MNRLFLSLLAMGLLCHAGSRSEDFIVSDEFVVTPAVRPGLVKHPIMAALDDRGRLFVSENAGVNLKKEELLAQLPNSIRLLIDTDRDGVYDKATTFADKLTFPQGALWIYDSLYVMSPPSLWRFADRDGDGVAEEREELATGFDFTGNAASTHGPFLHPNGRIFWAHGRKGYAVPDTDTGQIMWSGKGARIWSSSPSGGDLEPFAGGGMDNPVEVDFTETGEIVGTVNLFYGRPRGDTLTHWVHGGVYPRFDQEQAISDLPRTGDLLREVHNFGHVAVSGMCRYRSGKLHPDWKDDWIVSHFNTSRITRTRLTQEGAGYLSSGTEVIFELTKPDSHLTDVMEDHNGDILAIDTGGWFRIGCPTSHIAKPDVSGGIYRISRAGESYRAPSYPNWENLTSEVVSGLLDAEEFWLRERAGLELAGRGDPAIPELRRILRDEKASATAKRNAVWTLAKLSFSESADLVYEALIDEEPTVRQAACNALSVTRTWQSIAANQPSERLIELERNKTISGALARIVRSDEAPVARQAAVALGRMAENRAIGAILGRLGRVGEDRMLEHSLIYALIEIDDVETTRGGLSSENPGTLSGVLRALNEMSGSSLEVLDVLPHLDAENPALRKTATDIAAGHPEWDAALSNRFFEWKDDMTAARIEALRALIPPLAQAPPIQDFITTLLNSEEPKLKKLALELLSESDAASILPEWSDALALHLQPGAPVPLRDLTLQILAAHPAGGFEKDLEKIESDETLPRLSRLLAAQALTGPDKVVSEPAFALLLEILEKEPDTEVRSNAIGILTKARLTTAHRVEVASRAHHYSPVELPSLMVLFRSIRKPEVATAFSESIVKSPAFASLDLDRIQQILRPYPESISAALEERIAKVEAGKKQRIERIDTLLDEFKGADIGNGKTVFESGKGSCLVCHRIGDTGGKIGPDLSTIGRIRSARDLFESVLYPNESIARDFHTYEVKRKNDEPSLVGLIESQSASSILVIDPAGQSHRVPRSKIDSLVEIPTSLMPAGLEQTMTPTELRDLVGYLLSLQ